MRRKKVSGSRIVLLVVGALAGGFLLGLVSGAAPPVGHPASEVTPGTFAGSAADTFTFPGTVQAVSVSSPQITSSTLAATTAISSSGNIVTTQNFLEQNKKLCKEDGTDCPQAQNGMCISSPTTIFTTATNYRGNIGGYAAANQICQSEPQGTPTTRMCTAQDILTAQSCGTSVPVSTPAAWYSSATFVQDMGTTSTRLNDCNGWTGGLQTQDYGNIWMGYPWAGFCASPTAAYPIMCCVF